MAILLERTDCDYVEAWLPAQGDKEFVRHDYWYARPELVDVCRSFGDSTKVLSAVCCLLSAVCCLLSTV